MIFDGLVLVIVLAFAFFGFMRGFLRSLTGVLGWLLAAIGSLFALPLLHPLLLHYAGDSLWAFIGLACLVFFAFLLLTFFITDWLVHWVRRSPLKPIDNLLGALFALVKAGLLLCGLYWIFLHFHKSAELPSLLESSYTRPYIEDGVDFLKESFEELTQDDSVSDFFKRQFAFLEKLLDKQDANALEEHSAHSLKHAHHHARS